MTETVERTRNGAILYDKAIINQISAQRFSPQAERLKKIGGAASDELRKLLAGTDKEASTRARHILRVIGVRQKLTKHLLQTVPDLDERLARGDTAEWTRVLLELGGVPAEARAGGV